MKTFWINSIAGIIITVGVATKLVDFYHKNEEGKPTRWIINEDNVPSKAIFEANRCDIVSLYSLPTRFMSCAKVPDDLLQNVASICRGHVIST